MDDDDTTRPGSHQVPVSSAAVVRTRDRPHAVGAPVALRSVRDLPGRGPTVSFAVAGTVLQDDEELLVVMTRPGSGLASRAGRRGGPRGRNVVNAQWEGLYDVASWEGSTVVRVHLRGESWSLWRWHDGRDWTRRWYGNLEDPWRRTTIGYDTQDWALDVVAEGIPGTDDWEVFLKDEDELAWYAEESVFDPQQVEHIRRTGDELMDLLRRGTGLVGADWSRWLPRDDAPVVPLPAAWGTSVQTTAETDGTPTGT
ncbi:DUF402 domain-containing protein [Brachybacterium hainanense]|uniref:DUF402 domain-containing protein n=1 Tax=Brachybacterium hainanense TaxID=1541174 RepID=A0ABV6R8E8_9MICO